MIIKGIVVGFLYTVCALTLFVVSNYAPFQAQGVANIAVLHGAVSLFLCLSNIAGRLIAAAHTLWFVWLTASSAFIGPTDHEPLAWYMVVLIVSAALIVIMAFVRYAARRTPTDDKLYESIFAITPAIGLCASIGIICNSSIGDEMSTSVWRPQIRTAVFWTFVVILALCIESAKITKINMATQLAFAATLIYCVIYMPVELAVTMEACILITSLVVYRRYGVSAVVDVGDNLY